MPPDFHFNSYWQYKEDTKVIATWLVNKAQKCGYARELLQMNNVQAETRLKPVLNKKTSKNKSKKPDPDVPNNERQEHIIQIKDFIPLAQHIVNTSKPRIQVTVSFANILDRAINSRKVHLYRHQAAEKPQNKTSDKNHLHFITVLEDVQAILQPRMHAGTKDVLEAEKEFSRFMNRFSALTVEDTSEETASAVHQPHDERKPKIYEVEPLDELEEANAAIWCFFEDLNNLHSYIRDIWSGFRKGEKGLIAASITTNTAIELARQMANDLTTSFKNPQTKQPAAIVEMFARAQCLNNQVNPDLLKARDQPDDPLNFQLYDILQPTYSCPLQLLESAEHFFKGNSAPSYKPGDIGHFDPQSDRESKTGREKFQEDKIMMHEALAEFWFVCSKEYGRGAGDDEIVRCFLPFFKSKTITLELLFAVQAWLDIRNVLRSDAEKAFQELQRTALIIHWTIGAHWAAQGASKPGEEGILTVISLPQDDELLNGLTTNLFNTVIGWIANDPVAALKDFIKHKSNMRTPDPFNFYKIHPLRCGVRTYALKLMFNHSSILAVNHHRSILYLSHVYNAVRQEAQDQSKAMTWPDMEFAISQHGEKIFFVGNRPAQSKHYHNRFLLVAGASVTNFAVNKRETRNVKSRLTYSSLGSRYLQHATPVSSMFKEKFCEGAEARRDFTRQDIAKIAGNHPEAKSLLEALTDALDQEDIELSFDYMKLSRICWSIFVDIAATIAEEIFEDESMELPTLHKYLGLFVEGILQAGAATKKKFALELPVPGEPKPVTITIDFSVVQAELETSIKGRSKVCIQSSKTFRDTSVVVPLDIREATEEILPDYYDTDSDESDSPTTPWVVDIEAAACSILQARWKHQHSSNDAMIEAGITGI